MLVWPVIYFRKSAGESISLVLVLGLGVSPEVYAGVVFVLLSALSVMMLLMMRLRSSHLALGCGVLVLG